MPEEKKSDVTFTLPREMAEEMYERLCRNVRNYGTDFYGYCRFCGEHNASYKKELVHKENCIGPELLKKISEALYQ